MLLGYYGIKIYLDNATTSTYHKFSNAIMKFSSILYALNLKTTTTKPCSFTYSNRVPKEIIVFTFTVIGLPYKMCFCKIPQHIVLERWATLLSITCIIWCSSRYLSEFLKFFWHWRLSILAELLTFTNHNS